jgi:HK97 family phage portal protein
VKSGLRRLRNQVPVPMAPRYAGRGGSLMPGPAQGSDAYMQAYAAVGTIFSCVSLYAWGTSRPEWHLYRKQPVDGRTRYTTRDEGSDQRVEVIRHQALSVLGRPNDFTTRAGLFEAAQQYMDLAGEGPLLVERDPRATFPVGLWNVSPARLEPVPDPEKYLLGWIYTSPDGREKVPLGVDEVIFAKYPSPMDPYRGLGPVQSILVDADSSRYSAAWNKNFFLNSAVPGGVIAVDHRMEDDEWDEFQERWQSSHRGVARSHRVAMLEGGMTWIPNAMTMRDMDFAELRNLSRDVIREAFRMHKVMLGVSDDVNRANAQTGEEVFSNWGVVPRLDRWRDVLNNFFLPMFGSTGEGVEFDYIRPVPTNREQDNAELTAKCGAVVLLVGAGFDAGEACDVVGLPRMSFAAVQEAAVQPALPAPQPDETGADPAEQNRLPWAPFPLDEPRFRKVNGNGHMAGSLR